MKTFGQTIREIRMERQMLLREVAAKLEVDSSLLSRVENGMKLPSKEQIVSLAEIFNEDANKLLALYFSELVISVLKVDSDIAIEALLLAEQTLKDKERSNEAEFSNQMMEKPSKNEETK